MSHSPYTYPYRPQNGRQLWLALLLASLLMLFIFTNESHAALPAASMAEGRVFHTSTLLSDGRVLVTGGYNAAIPLNGAELYDPATDSWTPAANMSYAQGAHTATLLLDGRVLVVGNNVEIYDPVTDSWTYGKASSYSGHTATLLPNGQVLVVGFGAEIYDPDENSWTRKDPPTYFDFLHTATLLLDGRVLIVGGYDINGDRSANYMTTLQIVGQWAVIYQMDVLIIQPHYFPMAKLS